MIQNIEERISYLESAVKGARLSMTPQLRNFLISQKVLAFVAPPWAGKGTQLTWLKQQLGFETLEMGVFVRGALNYRSGTIADKNPMLEEFRLMSEVIPEEEYNLMARGRLMSDETALKIVNLALSWPRYQKASGIIMDGFPRNLEQMQMINRGQALWNGQPLKVGLFVGMDVPDETLRERSAYARGDRPDNGKTENRLQEFREQTLPLMDFLRTSKNTVFFDADNRPGTQEESILAVRNDSMIPALQAYADRMSHATRVAWVTNDAPIKPQGARLAEPSVQRREVIANSLDSIADRLIEENPTARADMESPRVVAGSIKVFASDIRKYPDTVNANQIIVTLERFIERLDHQMSRIGLMMIVDELKSGARLAGTAIIKSVSLNKIPKGFEARVNVIGPRKQSQVVSIAFPADARELNAVIIEQTLERYVKDMTFDEAVAYLPTAWPAAFLVNPRRKTLHNSAFERTPRGSRLSVAELFGISTEFPFQTSISEALEAMLFSAAYAQPEIVSQPTNPARISLLLTESPSIFTVSLDTETREVTFTSEGSKSITVKASQIIRNDKGTVVAAKVTMSDLNLAAKIHTSELSRAITNITDLKTEQDVVAVWDPALIFPNGIADSAHLNAWLVSSAETARSGHYFTMMDPAADPKYTKAVGARLAQLTNANPNSGMVKRLGRALVATPVAGAVVVSVAQANQPVTPTEGVRNIPMRLMADGDFPNYPTGLIQATGQIELAQDRSLDPNFKEAYRIGTGSKLVSIEDGKLRRVLDGSATSQEREELAIVPLLRALMQDIARWAKTSIQTAIAA